MEGDVSSATSCMPLSKIMEYPLAHDPFDSSCDSPLPLVSTEAVGNVDSSDVALMGNLLTDMLSSDFIYGSSSRYSVPDIMHNFAPDQASKMTLLQVLEDSTETATSSYSVHLKLPVLEEARDQQKVAAQLQSQGHQQQFELPVSPRSERLNKPCKPEIDPVQLHNSQLDQKLPMVPESKDLVNVTPPELQPGLQPTTTSTNSDENSSEKLLGVSQSSSGTETQQTRPKRKRVKSCKNSEEVESQRQTHIAVERNRRKQMNEHLNVLRSLMPGSYVQKGDQASIIGGAIEFVKELEQLLQCLQAQKRRRMYSEVFSPKPSPTAVTSMLQPPACPFPPYSPQAADSSSKFVNDNFYDPVKEASAEAKSPVADIEVKMTGSDAVVKILSQRRPGQLLKTISVLESMCMSIVHTNITTIEQTVLYSFTVKLGVECRLSAEDIAEAIQRVLDAMHCNSSVPA